MMMVLLPIPKMQDGEDSSPFLGERCSRLMVLLLKTWISPRLCCRWCGLCMCSLASVAATFRRSRMMRLHLPQSGDQKKNLPQSGDQKKKIPLNSSPLPLFLYFFLFLFFFWKFPFPKKKNSSLPLYLSHITVLIHSHEHTLLSRWICSLYMSGITFSSHLDPFP